ncbi:DNA repair protein RadC [Luteimonas sp. BDR2-5]|nr:DNA repair protein RadC [Luteimonas sp. BDR2-5]MCD9026808.1 DNA repair protein RadC [Luteimonas sp. BDR2-5]
MSRQDLIDQLLAPRRASERNRQSLLAERLGIAREILLRDLSSRLTEAPCLSSPDLVRQWLSLYFLGKEREVFVALFLDTHHRLICAEELFQGTIDFTEVHPREVVKQALRHNAAAVCVAHNHPSGNPEPSAADRAITMRLKQALALVDVRLLDHFVAGAGKTVSLAARGWV